MGSFLKQDFIKSLSIGTTQGNLSFAKRSIYLPLLLSFLETMLTSVLDPNPRNRLSAAKGKHLVEDIFDEIFCGNDFFRPKLEQNSLTLNNEKESNDLFKWMIYL